ncbi:phospholipase A and acyltransferase 2-like [Rhinoraja longicauda]
MNHRKSSLNPGDLIEISRFGFKHWAIYIGDGDVVHLTSDGASGETSKRFSRLEKTAVIKMEPLAEVAGCDPWCVNNSSDSRWTPLPIDKIIKRAKEMVGQKVHYDVINANCEHFVNSIRYGKSISFQVIKTCCIIAGLAIISPGAAAAAVAIGAIAVLKGSPSVSSSVSPSVKSSGKQKRRVLSFSLSS